MKLKRHVNKLVDLAANRLLSHI